MQEIILKRLVIYPKDIVRMTDKEQRSGPQFLQNIKTKLGKTKADLVSIDEFCQVTVFKLVKVAPFLVG